MARSVIGYGLVFVALVLHPSQPQSVVVDVGFAAMFVIGMYLVFAKAIAAHRAADR